jgi:hypothetical protein
MCECGREVFILKTMECKRCYQARWREENLEKRRAQDRAAAAKRYTPAPMVYTAAVPPTTPCSYEVAHQRVAYYRGSASTHVCTCGVQAEQWSYRNTSAYEIEGTRPNKSGTFKWSSNITDYDALCRRCHDIRDGKSFSDVAFPSPGGAPQNPSPAGLGEAL